MDDPRLKAMTHEVVTHERVDTLEQAAALRGVDPGAVIKTMVVRRGEDDYVFVLVPGDRVIDWPRLRKLLAARRLSLPDADEALAITGYTRGTITPFGAARHLPVIADERIAAGRVSIGGGAPGVSLTVDGSDLVVTLAAEVADVTKTRAGA